MDELSRTPEPGVVVGVNGSGTALRAVRWAAAEAHRRRVSLRIVHAAPYAFGDEGRAASVLTLAHTVAAHAQPQVPTYTECVFERPARVLIAAAEAARLLVIGMGSGSGFDDVPVRSLALDVCGAASCPDTARPVVDTALTAPASGALRPHYRSELR